MAGNSTKEVDLVIRAKDLSQKVLKENQAAIDEVTSALADQAKQAQKTDASLNDLETGLKGLSKVEADVAKQQGALEKALSSTAVTLDRAVNRQSALEKALTRTKGELAEARANAAAAAEAYSEYAASIGQGEAVTKKQQRTLDSLAKSVEKADAAVAKAGSDIVGYTIASRDAADQTQRLVSIQNQYVASQKAVAAALGQVSNAVASQRNAVQGAVAAQKAADEAARDAKKKAKQAEEDEANARKKNKSALDAFTTSQRESLSWYQRLRGEVIALATSYVGLQGALGLAKESLNAFQQRQQTSNVLGVAIGSSDTKKIGEEFEYIRGVADRLGFRFQDLAKQYGSFSVAARTAGASAQETRFIFEQVTKATRVLGLSGEDSKGVFLALQQMFSKGKISAEELRQQLGERLPGAVAILSKALNLGPGQLDKMLEKGSIGADKVLLLAKGIGDTFAKDLEPATKSLNAELGRFQTALDDFKISIADMGFAAAFTKFLRDLTQYLKSRDGQNFAKSLAEGFTTVLNVMQFVIKNFDTFKELLIFIVGLKVIQWFGSLAAGAIAAAGKVLELNAALTATQTAGAAAGAGVDTATAATTRFGTALAAVQKALLWLTAFFVGWEIGTLLDKQFKIVHDSSKAVADFIVESWVNVKHGVVIAAAEMTQAVLEATATGLRGIRNLKNGFIGTLMEGAKKFGLDGLADFLAKGISTGVETGFEDGIDAAKQAAQVARTARDREMQLLRDSRNYSPVELSAQSKKRIENGALKPGETPMPGKSTVPVAPPDNSKEIAKREKLEQSLSDQLNALNAKNEKSYKDSLDERIDATERGYKHIQDTIEKFKKAGGKEVNGTPLSQVEAQVAAMKDIAVEQEIVKFNTEELARGEKEVNDLLAERKNRIDEVTSEQKAGAIGLAEAFDRIKAINDEMVPQIQKAADLTKGFAAGLKGTSIDTGNKLDALISKMQRVQTSMTGGGANSPNSADGLNAFNQAMQETNTVLQARNAEVATYNQLVELGAYTQLEANEKIKAAFEATQPLISKSVEEMRALITTLHDTGNLSDSKFNALNAQLDLLATNAKYADKEMTDLKNAFSGSFTQGFQSFVTAAGDAFAGLITGTKSWGDAFKDLGKVALNALGSIAQAVANAITQMIALRIVSSMFSAFGGGAAAGGGAVVGGAMDIAPIVGVPIPHGGGIVGTAGVSGAGGNRSRSVNAGLFRNAPRYHSGTVVGLRSDEQAAILQKGEEVLSKDNPRNIMNQTAKNAAAGGGPLAIRNVLVTDPNMIPDAMQSAQGEKTLITVLGRNRAKVRKLLGF